MVHMLYFKQSYPKSKHGTQTKKLVLPVTGIIREPADGRVQMHELPILRHYLENLMGEENLIKLSIKKRWDNIRT